MNKITFISEKGKDHFAKPIIESSKNIISIKISNRKITHFINTIGSKNIWVEWATGPATVVSKLKRPWQNLIIRLHRFEISSKWMSKIYKEQP